MKLGIPMGLWKGEAGGQVPRQVPSGSARAVIQQKTRSRVPKKTLLPQDLTDAGGKFEREGMRARNSYIHFW